MVFITKKKTEKKWTSRSLLLCALFSIMKIGICKDS